MRPLRLEIEGLTAFADPAVVDFTELQLFAITGTTGAGKSTLIDAMLLALFGKIPRVGVQHAQLIAHGQSQMQVRLEFEANGQRYRVARKIRTRGPVLVQLERVLDNGATESIEGGARKTDKAIEEILGIGYDAFTRSVVLPQGQFDEFLRGDKAQRRAILVNLLGLSLFERMARAAGERHRQLQAEADAATQSLERDFAAATPENVAARQKELAEAEHEQLLLGTRATALTAAVRCAQELDSAQSREQQSDSAHKQARQRHAEALAAHQREQAAQAQFDTEKTQLEQQITALAVDPVRIDVLAHALPHLAPLLRLLTEHANLRAEHERAAARVQASERELTQANEALPALTAAVAARHAEVKAAETALERSQQQHAAMHLRATLTAGAPCPVCTQPIGKVPDATPADVGDHRQQRDLARAKLQAAEKLHAETERTRSQRAQDLPDLSATAEAARGRLQHNTAETQRLRQELAEAGIELPEEPDRTAVTQLHAGLQREHAALLQAAKRHRDLHGKLDALLARGRDATARLASAAAKVALLEENAGHADTARTAATAATASATAALAKALGAANETPPRTTAELQQLLVQTTTTIAQKLRRSGQLAEQVAHLQQAIATAALLRERLATTTAAAALARSLALLLRGDHFQDYVLEAAIQRLCRDGSTQLRQLSGSRYSLRHDGSDFQVVDHWNADRERSVRTLSGGETFLASLALSLALASGIRDYAARDGNARALECLFVDEGFGALDGDALEAAVQALEALHGGNRMVGVITHLQALAERLPARIAVENRAGRARIVAS